MNVIKDNKVIGTIRKYVIKDSPVYKVSIMFNEKNNKEKFINTDIDDIHIFNNIDTNIDYSIVFDIINNYQILKHLYEKSTSIKYDKKHEVAMRCINSIANFFQIEDLMKICNEYLYPLNNNYTYVNIKYSYIDRRGFYDSETFEIYGYIHINLFKSIHILDKILDFYENTKSLSDIIKCIKKDISLFRISHSSLYYEHYDDHNYCNFINISIKDCSNKSYRPSCKKYIKSDDIIHHIENYLLYQEEYKDLKKIMNYTKNVIPDDDLAIIFSHYYIIYANTHTDVDVNMDVNININDLIKKYAV